MPTVSPEPAPIGPHQLREVAESFGADVERYDRFRPRYPDALVGAIVAVSPGPDLLDVGCGTGIAARQFQAAGCTVLGVEPDARMAGFARRAGVEVDVATFEAWEPLGREFDAVTAAMAWHWVDPAAGAAKAARVLRPGGRLATFWHVFQPPSAVTGALVQAFRRVVPDSPMKTAILRQPKIADAYETFLDRTADGLAQTGGFADPERWRFGWQRSFTREEWLELLPTTGGLTRLSPEVQAQVQDSVGAAIDAIGGSFTVSGATMALVASRTG